MYWKLFSSVWRITMEHYSVEQCVQQIKIYFKIQYFIQKTFCILRDFYFCQIRPAEFTTNLTAKYLRRTILCITQCKNLNYTTVILPAGWDIYDYEFNIVLLPWFWMILDIVEYLLKFYVILAIIIYIL